VAASFAAARENPDDPILTRKAIQQRLALQREMGIDQPRLLSDAERDEIAGTLAQAEPADRPAIIADLRARYGEEYDGVVKELTGRVAPDTGVLMIHAGDPPLANALARGMAMDSVEFKGARVLTLPMIDGKLNSSRLEDKQLYTFQAGDRVVSVVYDRKADALVPTSGTYADLAEVHPPDAYIPMSETQRAELARQKEDYERENPFFTRFEQRLEAGGLNLRNAFGGMTLLTAYSSVIELESALRGQDEMMAEFEATLPSRDLTPEQIETARFLQNRERDKLEDLAISFRKLAEQTVQDMAKTYGELAAIPRNPVAERAIRAESVDEFFDVFMVDPMGVVGQFAIEGLVTSVPSIVGGVAGGVTGGPVGAAVGVGAGSALVVYGAKLNEKMLELGADPDDPASFERVVREHEEEIRAHALKWAAIVGLFDAATAGVGATRLMPRGGTLSHVAEAGAQLATQAGGGAAGEAVGQLATEGELREGEIAAELVTGIFTGAGEVGSLAVTGVRGKDTPITESAAELEAHDLGAELAPENVGNAPSGDALSGTALAEGLESGVETVTGSDPNVSVAGIETDQARRDGYYKSALHENFKNEETSFAEEGQEGRSVFGLADSVSGKRIVQPVNDFERMKAMAQENVQPLKQQLEELVNDLPGVTVHKVRAKDSSGVDRKLAGGRRPDTLTDYLGGRIVVDSPLMFDEAVRVLTRRYKNVEVDDFFENPDNQREIGYRAIHMQIVLDNGMTAEIQIMPSSLLPVYNESHVGYKKWQLLDEKNISAEQTLMLEEYMISTREKFDKAFQRWRRRTE